MDLSDICPTGLCVQSDVVRCHTGQRDGVHVVSSRDGGAGVGNRVRHQRQARSEQ
jgi:hypothetical protein